jgi:hypothetical protein
MFLLDLLFAFVVGFLIVSLFSVFVRGRTPWGSFWLFLLIVFLVTWAGGVWIEPFGPTLFDVAWAPFLIVGFFVTLLVLAAAVPIRSPRTPGEAIEQAREAEVASTVLAGLTVFFWIFLVASLVAIALGYIF